MTDARAYRSPESLLIAFRLSVRGVDELELVDGQREKEGDEGGERERERQKSIDALR